MLCLTNDRKIIIFKKALRYLCLLDWKAYFKRLISNDGAQIGKKIH